MHSVFDIANYLIQLGVNNKKPLNHFKIQKLWYIANGLSLYLYNKPLFHEKITAWPYGPVIDDLFHGLKDQKGFPITGKIKGASIDLNSCSVLLCVLNSFYYYYLLPSSYLTAICSKPGGAWDKTIKTFQPNLEIPNEFIKNEFKDFILNGNSLSELKKRRV